MSKWVKAAKKLPDSDRQVIALSGDGCYLSWLSNGEWHMTQTITLGGVTKWMEMPKPPKDWEYWKKLILGWWGSVKSSAESTSDWLKGWDSRQAQLGNKVTFYTNPKTGEIMTGLPENVPAPFGYQKVVCNNVRQAESWSERQRQWEHGYHENLKHQREQVEGPIGDSIRKEMIHNMANSRNNVNREFLRRALETSDAKQRPWEYERESFLHAEGYEKGN